MPKIIQFFNKQIITWRYDGWLGGAFGFDEAVFAFFAVGWGEVGVGADIPIWFVVAFLEFICGDWIIRLNWIFIRWKFVSNQKF